MNGASARRCARRCRTSRVYLSCEVLPEIREFERASTTAVCAVVGPVLASYLERLQSADVAAWPAEPACDGFVGWRVRHRRRTAHAGDGGGVRTRRRCDRGVTGRPAAWTTESDLVRHGRHHREGERDRRRRGVGHRRIRSRRFGSRQSLDARHRPSDPRAGDRSRGGQRGRRLDRLGRSRRCVEGRAAQRRCGARARGVWRRRHAADGDRRRCRAGLSRSRGAARRRICGSISPRRNARSTPRSRGRSG